MDDITRRGLLHGATGAGLLALLAPPAAARDDDKAGDVAAQKIDRESVLAAGLTEAEADCWELAAKLAGAFFDLPEMHPMDKQEVATAVHVIQYRLLSRPTYRKYKDTVKALSEKEEQR